MGSHREPKIAPNRKKSCSRGLPESTLKKVTKNDAIWVPSRPQNIGFRMRGVSKIKKSPVPKNDLKMTSKCLPFWMLLAPDLTKNACRKGTRKCPKKWIQKVFENDLNRGGGLARKWHQNQKNPSLGLKVVPQASRMGSQAPKMLAEATLFIKKGICSQDICIVSSQAICIVSSHGICIGDICILSHLNAKNYDMRAAAPRGCCGWWH